MVNLLLATNNQAKVREYRQLLQDLPYKLVTLADRGLPSIEEVGASLEENARLKALAGAKHGQLLSLGDDSGLEVDALGGEPGVMSARYAGEGASDSDRIDHLLDRLKDVPPPQRTALFRCVIALATPDGRIELCSGECHGVITSKPRGNRGFGYDPVFFLPELGKTMAELPMAIKNRVSHRGQAARRAHQILVGWRDNNYRYAV